MDKKKTELIATGVLILIFIGVLTNSIIKIKAKSPRPAASGSPVSSVESMPQENPQVRPEHALSPKHTSSKDAAKRTDPVWGRDPFVREESVISADAGVSSLKLMGITAGGSKSMAIINNEIVNTGSRIGKFTVIKIVKDRVVLTDGSENFELILNK